MDTLKNIYLSLVILSLFGCGEKMESMVRKPDQKIREIIHYELEGNFSSTEGEDVSLPKKTDKPIVLMFAGALCGACAEEVEELKSSFSDLNQPPSHIHLYTLVIYENMEEAQYWKKEHDVPWVVGADSEGILFKKYCVKDETPCTIIHHPQKGLLLRTHGKVPIERIKELVGSW